MSLREMLQMIFREGFLSICIGIREIVYSMFRRMCVSYTDASLEHRFLSNIGSLRGSNRIRGCREIGTKWNQSEGGTEIGGRGTEMGPKRDRNGTELGTEMGPKSKDRFYIGFFAIFSPVPLRAPQAPDQFGHQIFIRFGYRTRDPHCQAEFTPE